jgi:hypothetical protein
VATVFSERRRASFWIAIDTGINYQSFMSEIAGQDPHAHEDNPKKVILIVRRWLATNSPTVAIPGAETVWRRYQHFLRQLPALLRFAKLKKNEITFVEYTHFVSTWLQQNP